MFLPDSYSFCRCCKHCSAYADPKYVVFHPLHTRYDSNELAQSKKYEVEENQRVFIGEQGGKVPKSYEEDQKVCTYVDSATYFSSRDS